MGVVGGVPAYPVIDRAPSLSRVGACARAREATRRALERRDGDGTADRGVSCRDRARAVTAPDDGSRVSCARDATTRVCVHATRVVDARETRIRDDDDEDARGVREGRTNQDATTDDRNGYLGVVNERSE